MTLTFHFKLDMIHQTSSQILRCIVCLFAYLLSMYVYVIDTIFGLVYKYVMSIYTSINAIACECFDISTNSNHSEILHLLSTFLLVLCTRKNAICSVLFRQNAFSALQNCLFHRSKRFLGDIILNIFQDEYAFLHIGFREAIPIEICHTICTNATWFKWHANVV